ncbi:hypothetical protein Vadar_024901 [Vaccinium darrowii]|uniref:Uncharacterized protein n=1 Tax=Vaccinium darrowii TaxID=229202 RepID=A0ACB7X3U7_9ERIC|nr:hypothetical protein Vadar_024901 [Vaccinium darrowii]
MFDLFSVLCSDRVVVGDGRRRWREAGDLSGRSRSCCRRRRSAEVERGRRSEWPEQVLDNLPHDLIYSENQVSPWMEVWVEKQQERSSFGKTWFRVQMMH